MEKLLKEIKSNIMMNRSGDRGIDVTFSFYENHFEDGDVDIGASAVVSGETVLETELGYKTSQGVLKAAKKLTEQLLSEFPEVCFYFENEVTNYVEDETKIEILRKNL